MTEHHYLVLAQEVVSSALASNHSLRSISATAILLTLVALVFVSCTSGSNKTESDDNDSARTIRPLLGVNGGPTPFQPSLYPKFVDTTKQFQSLGVDAIRMVDYFGPNSITCMFPDPSADPSDESNYEFEATDAVFQAIVDGNFRPMLRLGQDWKVGEGISGYDVKKLTGKLLPDKPKSYPGCEFWKDGLAAGVDSAGPEIWKRIVGRYSDSKRWGKNALENGWVEIWNEPNIVDTTMYWDAEPEKFYEFFATTAKALDADFPKLRFGGPSSDADGCRTPDGRKWVDDFLTYLDTRDVPLDFFSWHWYGANIEELRGCHLFYSKLLDRHGYGEVPQIVTEYNTDARACAGAGRACHPHGNLAGGALATTAWIEMQSWPDLEGLFVYRGADGPFIPNSKLTMPLVDGDPCPGLGCKSFGGSGLGLLHGDGTRKPQGAAFSLWSMLAGMESVDLAEPSLFVSEVDDASLANAGTKLAGGLPILGVLAGRDQSGKVRLLVANPQDVTMTVDIAGLLRSGQIESSDGTTITVTSLTAESLTADTRDLVSSSEAEAGTLGAAELEPFSVQVYELQG
jgi:hypothetical protein